MTAAEMVARPDFMLGSAVVHPSTRTITGPGGTASLEPRVMQVLLVLADAAGAVVTRDTLLSRCWGGVYVGDDSLNRAVAGVRRVASSVADGSFEIETVPRAGYRLVTRIEAPPPASEREGDRSSSTLLPRGRVARRWVLGGSLAAAAGGIALWTTRHAPADASARLIEESQIAMRAGTPAATRRAIALLEQAVVASPDNPNAWGLLALTRAQADEHGTERASIPAAAIDAAARRALQLEAGNADAKAALAIALPYYGDWLAAERRFDGVLQLHPRHAATRDSRSFFLGAVGRIRESALDRLSFSRSPPIDAGPYYRHIYALWFIDEIAEADRVAGRGMEIWPRHPGIWFGRLWLLASTGRIDRAIAHIDDEAGRPPLPLPMFATLRAAISAAGSRNTAEVESAVQRIMADVGRSVAAVVNAMMLLNLMEATDKAFDLANGYYLERGPIIAAMQWRPGQPLVPDQRRRKTNMLFTPTAAPMRRDPRFMPLVERMGMTEYWNNRGVVPDFLARGV